MDYIAELRKYDGTEEDDVRGSEVYEEIESLLYRAKAIEAHKEFEEGGRWYNIEKTVHEVNTSTETAYFEINREVNASESQDGQENAWGFREVYPREITTTIYE